MGFRGLWGLIGLISDPLERLEKKKTKSLKLHISVSSSIVFLVNINHVNLYADISERKKIPPF